MSGYYYQFSFVFLYCSCLFYFDLQDFILSNLVKLVLERFYVIYYILLRLILQKQHFTEILYPFIETCKIIVFSCFRHKCFILFVLFVLCISFVFNKHKYPLYEHVFNKIDIQNFLIYIYKEPFPESLFSNVRAMMTLLILHVNFIVFI